MITSGKVERTGEKKSQFSRQYSNGASPKYKPDTFLFCQIGWHKRLIITYFIITFTVCKYSSRVKP
jgi:hypothetical protein